MLRSSATKKDTRQLESVATSRTEQMPLNPPWPVSQQRPHMRWYPTRQRLIGLVRCSSADSFVLPPAIVRKASWRE